MHRDARSSELRRLLLPIFGHRSHIAIADNEGQGNATTGIADLADYYQLLSARNLSHASTSSRQDFRRHAMAAEGSSIKSKTS